MNKTRILLLFSLSAILIFNTFTLASLPKEDESSGIDDDYDEDTDQDLKFLLKQDIDEQAKSSPLEDQDEDDEEERDSTHNKQVDREELKALQEFDEKDVVVLKGKNFTSFIKKNRYVMVQFYVPRCSPCDVLAPEYAAAATALKGEAVFAKVNATQEKKLARKYEIMFMPMVYFFVDGVCRGQYRVHKPYSGHQTKDGLVSWVKKRTGPGAFNITTLEDAEHISNIENKFVLGFLNSLVGPESSQLCSASRREDDINFYQTDNPDVAKFFHINPTAKRPALVLVKKEDEKFSHFDGNFTKSAILKFARENKIPLVISLTKENAPLIFESNVKKQIILFGTSNSTEKVLPIFREAAKSFKGKLIFVYADLDSKDIGKEVLQFFRLNGDSLEVMAFSTESDDGKKYKFNGELTLESIKVFGKDFVGNKLKPFIKSDPIPDINDGDIKIVVADNFDEIVLDESKDVLLKIYAPSCSRCQALEPTYNKLAKHLSGIDSLVIAKMDGTTNEHPCKGGFPTFLFFPAGKKNINPKYVERDHTLVGLYKFLKKHARIPFKLQRPTLTSKLDNIVSTKATSASNGENIASSSTHDRNTDNLKDEL
ncbi:hypothetical protein AQUCO_00100258v1 [Aquilegia coerulea]|uniref:protein disulfide-isomerase n=1 Tax=Aquilegia coerulea TaxID=218851 RepID=A0A2G5F9K1_AQUCA|nr:hypothetical protein AQUCO_00100258v1 [Aquilegia coerulea]